MLIVKSWSQGTAGGRRLLPASVLVYLVVGMVMRPTSMLHCTAPTVGAPIVTMQSCGPSCASNWSVRLGKRKYGLSWEELGDEQQYQTRY